jgi:ABC-2 type transport system permease protein
MKKYLALIAIDLKLAARLRVVIFFNYLFPLMIFFIFGTVFGAARSVEVITYVLTMSVVLGILGNGLFGAGMRAVQEREMNILRRYKVTPITPAPLLVASMVTGWVIFMPYMVFVFTLAHSLYKMPWPQHLGFLAFFISVGLVAFRAIGLVIASVANNMQEGTILVQICYFPMLFLSGATVPAQIFPHIVQVISKFIPATYLVLGVQGIILQNLGFAENWKQVGALLITAIVGFILGVKLFRWEKEEKITTSAKLWIIAVLLPFFILGTWYAYTGESVSHSTIFDR